MLTKTKQAKPSPVNRKPIRPIDRLKMRPWLENILDNKLIKGSEWLDKSKEEFQISWRHAARHGWSIDLDANIFEAWAKHTGKYVDGDNRDPKRWKANFRCALHSLPDVEELNGNRKGANAYRRYRFLEEPKASKMAKRGKQKSYQKLKPKEVESTFTLSETETSNQDNGDFSLVDDQLDNIPEVQPEHSQSQLPKFDEILSGEASFRQILPFHHSGGRLFVSLPDNRSQTPEANSPPPDSLYGGSESDVSSMSDEEVVELVTEMETNGPDTDLESYHPRLWNEDLTELQTASFQEEYMAQNVITMPEHSSDVLWNLTAMEDTN